MKLIHQTGFGKMNDDNGNPIEYPINRLIIRQENGAELPLKLDKTAKALFPFFVKAKTEDYDAQDINGQQVKEKIVELLA